MGELYILKACPRSMVVLSLSSATTAVVSGALMAREADTPVDLFLEWEALREWVAFWKAAWLRLLRLKSML